MKNMSTLRTLAGAIGWSFFLLWSVSARAEESAYCKKVRARAASNAALLYAPTIQAQGIKFPNDGRIDTGATTGTGYQFRASLSVSPLDMYKGARVTRVGEADCKQHDAAAVVRDLVADPADFGRLTALTKQVEFLDSRRAQWEAIGRASDERLAAHVSSLREAAEVQARLAAITRSREHQRGEAARLGAAGVDTPSGSLRALVAAAENEAMRFEREASHVRSLEPWDVRVTGGVIPREGPVETFGFVLVGLNLGTFSRNAAESRYLDARADELRGARYELRDQLARFRAAVKSTAEAARRELAIVNSQLALLASDRSALEHADAPNAAQALALTSLDMILVESERTYLTTLVEELSRVENEDGH
jgi:hypothetical protein